MPYPDDFNQKAFDNAYGDIPKELEYSYNRMLDAQDAWKGCLTAITAVLKEYRFNPKPVELEIIMEGIGEALSEKVMDFQDALAERGISMPYVPDDAEKLCAKAAEELQDNVRIKPIDWHTTLVDILKPIPNQAMKGFSAGRAAREAVDDDHVPHNVD